jgi:hypothetical protein
MSATDVELKKRIRRSALTWSLVAVGFFVGFIALTLWRAYDHG